MPRTTRNNNEADPLFNGLDFQAERILRLARSQPEDDQDGDSLSECGKDDAAPDDTNCAAPVGDANKQDAGEDDSSTEDVESQVSNDRNPKIVSDAVLPQPSQPQIVRAPVQQVANQFRNHNPVRRRRV